MQNLHGTKPKPKRLRRLSLIGCGEGARKQKRRGREAAAAQTAKGVRCTSLYNYETNYDKKISTAFQQMTTKFTTNDNKAMVVQRSSERDRHLLPVFFRSGIVFFRSGIIFYRNKPKKTSRFYSSCHHIDR